MRERDRDRDRDRGRETERDSSRETEVGSYSEKKRQDKDGKSQRRKKDEFGCQATGVKRVEGDLHRTDLLLASN